MTRAAAIEPAIGDLTSRLAGFAGAPCSAPESVRAVARLSALDWVAVGLAGREEPVARILRVLAAEEGGTEQSSLFAAPRKAPARMAALVNGATSHALDYDDTHFAHIGHPSVAVFPAALAVAEAERASLPRMLEAALVGMELSIRVGLWLGRSHYQAGFHQTATAGAFGAAAAAARLMRLETAQTALCLGLVATRAAGLKAQFGTMGKPYHAGMAAAAGVEAAQLVRAGFIANPDALEGPFGFAATHHGAADAGAALEGLGTVWQFETVSHKFHACCHGLHAALEALRGLDVRPDTLARVVVTTHPRWMSVCNQPEPTTGLGAKFSYSAAVALHLLGHDTARLESYSDTHCADPRLIALRDLVEVVPDDTLRETEARIALHHRGGRIETAQHDLDAPLPLDAREARVAEKAKGLIGADRTEAVRALLRSDAAASELGDLIRG